MKNSQTKFKETELGEIPEDWKVLRFDDFVELKKESYKPQASDNLPYIGLEHIDQQALTLNSVGSSDNVASNKYRFKSGDILFGKLRPYFKKVFQPKFDGVCSTDIWVIKAKNGIDQNWLHWFVANQGFVDMASSGSKGTKMPRADWDQIAISKWLIPPLPEQKKIAEVLGALDEKIELNRKMNKTLEQIGQAIFKKWFIDDADPNWETKKIEDVVNLISRGPSLKYIEKNGIPVLNQRCVRNNEIDLEAIQYAQKLSKNKKHLYLEKNDILINSMGEGTLGRISRNLTIDYKMIIHNCITVIRANQGIISQYLLYYQLKRLEHNLTSMGAGTTGQTSLKLEIIKNIKIFIPSRQLLEKFDQQISNIWELIGRNKNQIQTLSQIRDSLLPRLMSGKLKVK